jgi:uncharacterized protein YecE (DUF72 family)
MVNVLVGTSSWTDKSLIDSGRFYPPSAKTPDDRLRYYASQFPIVEIDSSYYGIPVEANARLWVERTPPEFAFNIKAYRLFTRHQTPAPGGGEPASGPLRRLRPRLGTLGSARASATQRLSCPCRVLQRAGTAPGKNGDVSLVAASLKIAFRRDLDSAPSCCRAR